MATVSSKQALLVEIGIILDKLNGNTISPFENTDQTQIKKLAESYSQTLSMLKDYNPDQLAVLASQDQLDKVKNVWAQPGSTSKDVLAALNSALMVLRITASKPANYFENLCHIQINIQGEINTPTAVFDTAIAVTQLLNLNNTLMAYINMYDVKGRPSVSAEILEKSDEMLMYSQALHDGSLRLSPDLFLEKLDGVVEKIPH